LKHATSPHAQMGTSDALPSTPPSDSHTSDDAKRDSLIELFRACGTMENETDDQAPSALQAALFSLRCSMEETSSALPLGLTYMMINAFGLKTILTGRAQPWTQFATLLLARMLSIRVLRRGIFRQYGRNSYIIPLILQRVCDAVVFATVESCPWPVQQAAGLFVVFIQTIDSWAEPVLREFVTVGAAYMGPLHRVDTRAGKMLLVSLEFALRRLVKMNRVRAHWDATFELQCKEMTGDTVKYKCRFVSLKAVFGADIVLTCVAETDAKGWDYKVTFEGDFENPRKEDFRVSLAKQERLPVHPDVRRLEQELNECAMCGANRKKLFYCAGCQARQYCSRACHKAHWEEHGHRKECRALKSSMAM